MIQELDPVVLTHDVRDHGLKKNDVGAVVHAYRSGDTFEVEFVDAAAQTLAVVTLTDKDVKPLAGNMILQARDVKSRAPRRRTGGDRRPVLK